MPAAETSRLRDWTSPDDPYRASWPHRSIIQDHGRSRYCARARSRPAAVGAAVIESVFTSRAAIVNSRTTEDRVVTSTCHIPSPRTQLAITASLSGATTKPSTDWYAGSTVNWAWIPNDSISATARNNRIRSYRGEERTTFSGIQKARVLVLPSALVVSRRYGNL